MALASSSTLPPPPPPSVAYHCSCQFADPVLPYPYRPAAGASFYPLAGLFFCEECDAVKCQRCVSTEVACYYCPHCLFEVPNASVRAELNRCVRASGGRPRVPSSS
jgi:dynactin-4